MRIERVRVRSFGRLVDLDTGPEALGNLVVVHGPNEGGKTTLFQFFATALYGFHPAAKDSHPYAPWNGAELDGSVALLLSDGTRCEVHRRLGSNATGSLDRGGLTEDLRNKTIPSAEHVSPTIFRQCYALTLSELGALKDDSWLHVQDRLIAGLGASDLQSARDVVEGLDEEAGALWRPTRRGNQVVRQLRERLRELEAQRREVADSDRTLRELVHERERVLVELAEARTERETDDVYVERFRSLMPIRAALARVRALEQEAGFVDDLAELPADPAARLKELEARLGEQEARIEEIARDVEAPRQRSQAARPGDSLLLVLGQEIERVTARVQASAWMRARANQLQQELRELNARAESEASELFDQPLDRIDPEHVRGLAVRELKACAGDLDEARAKLAVERETVRRVAESGDTSGWGGAAAGLLVTAIGAVLLVVGLVADRGSVVVAGAVALGAGAMLIGTGLRPSRRRSAGAPTDPALVERETTTRQALVAALGGLPARASLIDRAPSRLASGVERLQQTLRDRRDREAELEKLRRESKALADEMTALATKCTIEVPDDPVAAAHLLAAAAAEAGRRKASAERADEEIARLERVRARETSGLERLRMSVEGLRSRLGELGNGDSAEGLRRFRMRTKAAAEATRILQDLQRAHPDLEDLRVRIRQAEEASEEWVVDEEAVARRRVRMPELSARVEALAAKEAALRQDIEHLASGDTLDGIDGEIESIEEQVARLERERDRKHVLGRLIREADRRFREQHQPELVRRAGEYLSTITGGRYQKLLLTDGDGELGLRLREASSPHPVAIEAPLSTATREQVYLALRLAAVDQLDKEGERLPLFLDETLVNWDPTRRDRGLDLLACVAKGRQVFVFTAQPESARALAERGARLIELAAR